MNRREPTRLAVVNLDTDLRFTAWSRQAQHLLGWTADEVLGHHTDKVFPLTRIQAIGEIHTDDDLRIHGWDTGARHITGWEPEQVLGRSISELTLGGAAEGKLSSDRADRIAHLHATGGWEGVSLLHTPDGGAVAVQTSVRAIPDPGRPNGYVGVIWPVFPEAEHAVRLARDDPWRGITTTGTKHGSLVTVASVVLPLYTAAGQIAGYQARICPADRSSEIAGLLGEEVITNLPQIANGTRRSTAHAPGSGSIRRGGRGAVSPAMSTTQDTDRAQLFGTNLRRVLTELGLTQEWLGIEIGVARAHMNKYANGHREPRSLERLSRIAGALETELASHSTEQQRHLRARLDLDGGPLTAGWFYSEHPAPEEAQQ